VLVLIGVISGLSPSAAGLEPPPPAAGKHTGCDPTTKKITITRGTTTSIANPATTAFTGPQGDHAETNARAASRIGVEP